MRVLSPGVLPPAFCPTCGAKRFDSATADVVGLLLHLDELRLADMSMEQSAVCCGFVLRCLGPSTTPQPHWQSRQGGSGEEAPQMLRTHMHSRGVLPS